MLDGMDINIFSLIIPSLLAAFAIGRGEAGALATAALVSSAFGGWLAGVLSDRFGRLPVLHVTILWFSLATILCGFVHNYDVFLAVRVIQGLGFGGEWAVGSVLMGEIIRKEIRGKTVGGVQSVYAIGCLLALGLFCAPFALFAGPNAWRILFVIAGLLGIPLFIARMRMRLEGFQTAEMSAHARTKTDGLVFLQIFRSRYIGRTVLASLMCLGMLNSAPYIAVYDIGTFCGYLCAAYLCDLIGRRRKILIFAVASLVIAVSYLQLPIDNALMFILGFPLGFFTLGIYSGIGLQLTEMYPRHLRGAGQGFCYNFGRGAGALRPAVIGFASMQFGLAKALVALSTLSYFIVGACVLLLPENSGMNLEELDRQGKQVSRHSPATSPQLSSK